MNLVKSTVDFFKNKYNVISVVLLLLVVVAQLIPFTNSTKLYSEVENPGKTWAELPVGQSGKDRSDWPPEIKYGEFKDWAPEVQAKYPLYGERAISIFTYVWNPAGALYGHKVNAFIFTQVAFIAFLLFTLFVKNFMAKAVVAFILALANIWAVVQSFILNSSGDLVLIITNADGTHSVEPGIAVIILLAVIALGAIVAGVYFIPEHFRMKKHNEEIRKSL